MNNKNLPKQLQSIFDELSDSFKDFGPVNVDNVANKLGITKDSDGNYNQDDVNEVFNIPRKKDDGKD